MWSCLFVAHTTRLVWEARDLCCTQLLKDPDWWRPHGHHVGERELGGPTEAMKQFSLEVSSITVHSALVRTSLIIKSLENVCMCVDILWAGKISATCSNPATKPSRTATLFYFALYFLHSACLVVDLSINLSMRIIGEIISLLICAFRKTLSRNAHRLGKP